MHSDRLYTALQAGKLHTATKHVPQRPVPTSEAMRSQLRPSVPCTYGSGGMRAAKASPRSYRDQAYKAASDTSVVASLMNNLYLSNAPDSELFLQPTAFSVADIGEDASQEVLNTEEADIVPLHATTNAPVIHPDQPMLEAPDSELFLQPTAFSVADIGEDASQEFQQGTPSPEQTDVASIHFTVDAPVLDLHPEEASNIAETIDRASDKSTSMVSRSPNTNSLCKVSGKSKAPELTFKDGGSGLHVAYVHVTSGIGSRHMVSAIGVSESGDAIIMTCSDDPDHSDRVFNASDYYREQLAKACEAQHVSHAKTHATVNKTAIAILKREVDLAHAVRGKAQRLCSVTPIARLATLAPDSWLYQHVSSQVAVAVEKGTDLAYVAKDLSVRVDGSMSGMTAEEVISAALLQK